MTFKSIKSLKRSEQDNEINHRGSKLVDKGIILNDVDQKITLPTSICVKNCQDDTNT